MGEVVVTRMRDEEAAALERVPTELLIGETWQPAEDDPLRASAQTSSAGPSMP